MYCAGAVALPAVVELPAAVALPAAATGVAAAVAGGEVPVAPGEAELQTSAEVETGIPSAWQSVTALLTAAGGRGFG